jgi:excisionase family DNA binding protein
VADRTTDTAALFVRIPQSQARALDRLAFESGRPKQAVVSELLARYVDEPAARREPPPRRASEPELGRHSFRSFETDVLTLEGVAALLAVEPELIAALAERGELPGRRIGAQWRFARSAVLDWLAAGGPVPARADR